MAAKRMSSGHFFCDICEVGFPYRSKYMRHLASDTHQRFSDLLSLDSIEHMGVAKFTRSEERGCGFVLRKFQQARTARVCTLALLLNDLEIDSSLLPSPIPSLK